MLKFRHLLEAHNLGAALFAKVGELLQANGVKLSGETIVDATLIDAPFSTQKRNQWYFGMKLHIGMNSRTGLAHHASVTTANVHDSHEAPNLLFGNETRFYGDSAYRSKAQRQRLKELAPKVKDFTNKRAYQNRPLSEADKATNRRKSQVRASGGTSVSCPQAVVGLRQGRYRDFSKNANRAFAMLALANLVKWGRPLTGEVRPK